MPSVPSSPADNATQSECKFWCGMPKLADVEPMGCGVLLYAHIPKTGGTSVQAELERLADHTGWNYRRMEIFNNESTLALFKQHVRESSLPDKRAPHDILQLHVKSPWLMGEPSLFTRLLLPLEASLARKNCSLVLATNLREPVSRIVSDA